MWLQITWLYRNPYRSQNGYSLHSHRTSSFREGSFCVCIHVCVYKIIWFDFLRSRIRFFVLKRIIFRKTNINRKDVDRDESNYWHWRKCEYNNQTDIIKIQTILSSRIMQSQSFIKFEQEHCIATATAKAKAKATHKCSTDNLSPSECNAIKS